MNYNYCGTEQAFFQNIIDLSQISCDINSLSMTNDYFCFNYFLPLVTSKLF